MALDNGNTSSDAFSFANASPASTGGAATLDTADTSDESLVAPTDTGGTGDTGAGTPTAVSTGPRPRKPKPVPAAAAAPAPAAVTTAPPAPVQGATFVAAQRDPARWARVMKLSQQWNVSPDFADRNFDRLSQSATKQQSDQQVAGASPTLANWLSDPDNATLAKDELTPLATVDRSTGLLSRVTSDVGNATATGTADLAASAGQLAVAYGMASPADAARFVADMNLRAKFLREQAPGYAKVYDAANAGKAATVDQDVALMAGTQEPSRTRRILNVISQLATVAPGNVPTPGAALTLGDVLDELRTMATHPKGAAYQGAESLASMAPMMGGATVGAATGAAIGSAVPVIGTAVGGVVGGMTGTFAGMAPVNVGSEINAELTKRGVDVTDADALERAFSDPTLMQAIRAKAERAGITNALVASLTSGFAGKLGELAKGSSVATRVAAHAADVGVQAAGMGAGQAAGQAASGDQVSIGQAIQTAVSTLGVSAGMEAIGASRRAALHPETDEAAIEATTKADDALQAHHDAALLAQIGTAVHDAPNTAAVPDRLRDLVETAAGGADASTVYFQSDDWNRYWQAKGESPAEQAAQIMQDGGAGYTEAQATGAPLAIPLADYVARVAPTEHFDGLLPSARMRPDGASLAEAQSYLADLPATMHELATEAQSPAGSAASARRVGADVAQQLTSAGTKPVEAKANAALWARAFQTLGERTGIDPLELYQRYRVTIGRGDAEGAIAEPPRTVADVRSLVEGTKGLLEESRAEADRRAAEREANTDPLTGVANGRALAKALPAAEADPETGVLLFDANNFGLSNKVLGHAGGDALLKKMAAAIHQAAEESGVGERVFRNHEGGDEFTVLGPHDALDVVKQRAADLFGEHAFEHPEKGPFAVSLSGTTGDTMADADATLQAAKAERKAAAISGPILDPQQFEQATGATPRGRVTLSEAGIRIDLLEHADRSTFVHETGHAFLHILDQLGTGEHAAPELAADRATVRTWLGAEGDAPLTRDQHEQFAKGFEAYLGEGKAPSADLRGVFARFQRWLLGVYGDLRALHVNLSDDVRRVFDRLLASQDDLDAATRAANVEPLFSDPTALGLSEAQATRYRDAVTAARLAAEEAVTARVMRQLRREESREWKTLRDPIVAEVTTDVDAEPVYQARALMEKGTRPDGSPLAEGVTPFKLSKAAVVQGFGDAMMNGLPRGVVATEGGIHPDVAADLLGFTSGRELLDALRAAPNRADEIRARADARMEQEHGPRMTDEDVRDQASLAVRNEKRAQLLRRELEILASDHLATMKGLVRAVTRVVPSTEAIRAQAETIIGGKSVAEVKPRQYELAARRAATEARDALLRGDLQRAFDAKRRELLNTELLRSATAARATIDGALDEFKQVFRRDAKLSDMRDMDLVNAARAILATFGIGRTDKPASAYLEQVRQYDPETYDSVVAMVNDATTNARDYRQLSIDDFRALHETVSSLWELSRRARQIEIDGRKVERHAIVDELAQRLETFVPAGPKPGERQAVTRGEKQVGAIESMWAALRHVEHWVRQMDGGADDGAFRRYVWNPVNDGAVRFRIERNRRMEQYRAIVDRLGPTMSHEKIPAPELGYTFGGKRELLGALLHTGNESNLRKLLVGRGWGALDDAGVLDSSRWRAFVGRMHAEGTLVKGDYEFAQAVWDLFEETKPDAQRAHRDMYGRYFEEITAQPFATPFGRYEGGYYPAKADPFLVPEQGRRESATAVVESDNSNLFPSTGRGFTKSRVEYNRPLIIDANAIPTHLDAVLRFTHINPHVVDVARILRDRTFAGAMDDADAHAISELLDPFLRRSAQQAIDTPAKSKAGRSVDTMARWIRTNAAMQILSTSLTTAAEQVTHVPSVVLRVTPSALARGLWAFARAPIETSAEIRAKSDYMATRETAGLIEVRRAIDHIMLDASPSQHASAWVKEHASFLARAIQHVEDHVTWGGAYEDAVRGGMDETAAVRHADAIVREVLGAFEPESISRFEASAPVVKLFSMFASFFINKANFLKTAVTNVLRAEIGIPQKAAKLAAVYTFAYMIPAVMAGLIKQQLSGQPLDKDGDGPWDDLFDLFWRSQLEQGARMIPVAGPLAEYSIEHMMGGRPVDLVSSPAMGLLQQGASVPADAAHVARDRQITHGEITDLFTLIGLMTGTPARPLAKPIGYLLDVEQGKAQPTGPVDRARGLLTGR